MMSLPFFAWKRQLIASAGTASAAVERIGDLLLELFYRDGCEPTLDGLLGYAQAGLRPTAQADSPQPPRVRPSL